MPGVVLPDTGFSVARSKAYAWIMLCLLLAGLSCIFLTQDFNVLATLPWPWPEALTVQPCLQQESVQNRDASEIYWLNSTAEVIATMQFNYWNGTYWPSTIQWVGALINTLVAATDTVFVMALLNNGNVSFPATTVRAPPRSKVQDYYDHIRNYYRGEDTEQIFEAAYDDAQWVVLEWLEALRLHSSFGSLTNETLDVHNVARYAHRAHLYYDIVQDQFDTSLCDGGLTWNPKLATYKNAITNELFITSSIEMYLGFPGDNNVNPYPSPTFANNTRKILQPLAPLTAHNSSLLEIAEKAYIWFAKQKFKNSRGLIVDGFHISRGQKTCDQRNEMVYTYNQGVLLSGLRSLWEATGNTTYLQDGYNLIHATISATGWNHSSPHHHQKQWSGLGRNGIMEDYCDAAGTCSQDQRIFKGAYFHHLDLFCTPLPTDRALVPGDTFTAPPSLAAHHVRHCMGYMPWVDRNARAALATRDAAGVIGQWWNEPRSKHKSSSIAPQEWMPAKLPAGAVDIRKDDRPRRPAGSRAMLAGGVVQRPLGVARRAVGADGDVPWAWRQVRTVETQAQGLAVVKCMANLVLRYGSLP